MKLTKTGWPRPVVNGLPIPWVSPSDKLSTMNSARAAACASGAVCAVCGEGYADDEPAYVLVTATDAPADIASVDVQAMDNGILHKRCVQLALAMCPKLKSMIAEGRLQIVSTTGNNASVIIDDEGTPKARVDGADCAVVDRASLRSAPSRYSA